MGKYNVNDRRVINITGAAIVCSHVARDGYPVLLAKRDDPMDPDDSGWQFLCGSGVHEDEQLAQVWAVSEVVEKEPTLKGIIGSPVGSKFVRRDKTSPWTAVISG